MRDALRLGSSALVLVAIMFVGGLVLWVGVPLAWLWIASQIQAQSGSLGAAVAFALLGAVASIIAMMALLGRLSDVYRRQRVARGLDDVGHLVLEIVMVTSAALAVAGFGAWFLLFSGSSPIPFASGS